MTRQFVDLIDARGNAMQPYVDFTRSALGVCLGAIASWVSACRSIRVATIFIAVLLFSEPRGAHDLEDDCSRRLKVRLYTSWYYRSTSLLAMLGIYWIRFSRQHFCGCALMGVVDAIA